MKNLVLLCALVLLLAATRSATAENIVFPPEAGVINVQTRYGAKGDGRTDDTDALQHAIFERKGTNAVLYFPNGTYLVSRTLFVGGTEYSPVPIASTAHSSDRFMKLQGQSEAGVIIKLKDNCPGFDNPEKPKTLFSLYDGQGTGDAMHTYVRNMTFDVGKGNPGAAGLRFLANNIGAMYNVTIRSSDPKKIGSIGLDLRQGQQGPSLMRDVTIEGFDRGVETDDTFALVFERLTLKHQNEVGFLNPTGRLTIRGLTSDNKVPVLKTGGSDSITLIEGDFKGGDPSTAAILCDGRKIYLRDLKQSGYGAMVAGADGKKIPGDTLAEWTDGEDKSLFSPNFKSLRLPIKETPEVPWEEDFSKWVILDASQGDDTASIQKQLDAAARDRKTTVCFQPGEGKYKITGPIRVHGTVNRIIGMESIVDVADPKGIFATGKAVFNFENLSSPVIVVERFFMLGGWNCPETVTMFENKAGKTVVVQNLVVRGAKIKNISPSGEWFIDDVSTNNTLRVGPQEKMWLRQFNPERWEVDLIDVNGGQIWLLGLKTEGRGTHIVARNGARVELLGGVSYQSWGPDPLEAVAFKITDSTVFFTFGIWDSPNRFSTIVIETKGGKTKTLLYSGLSNGHLGVYRAEKHRYRRAALVYRRYLVVCFVLGFMMGRSGLWL